MSDYTEIANHLTDQWIASLERATIVLPDLEESLKALSTFPAISVGEVPSLPSPKEVVEANYAIAQRLLAAQRDFALAVIKKSSLTETETETSAKPPAAAAAKPAAAAAKPAAAAAK
ncbi:hypothetical protein [Mycobacterium sp. 141]|uniref:hypothetical protein n=1 Tax=Mycobacterium sp. 141 TaxID=1120797 RepID=UPI0012DE5C73|nr:hypothetical protein [Mycobacterium sp. 141]